MTEHEELLMLRSIAEKLNEELAAKDESSREKHFQK